MTRAEIMEALQANTFQIGSEMAKCLELNYGVKYPTDLVDRASFDRLLEVAMGAVGQRDDALFGRYRDDAERFAEVQKRANSSLLTLAKGG